MIGVTQGVGINACHLPLSSLTTVITYPCHPERSRPVRLRSGLRSRRACPELAEGTLRLFTTKERPRGVLPLFYIPDHRHRFGATLGRRCDALRLLSEFRLAARLSACPEQV